jgi:hypothetical protein
MADKVSIFSSVNSQDTSFVYMSQENIIGYFQLGLTDLWGQESLGESMRASSFHTFRTIYENEQTDQGISLLESSTDNQYIIAGKSSSFGDFGHDGFLTKVEDDGQTLWLEAFGGANPEAIYDLAETPDGGFILVGSTESYGSMLKDVFVIKVDQNGVLEWTNTYGGNDLDEGKSVYIGEDGLLYLIGYTRSFGFGEADIWLIVIDSQGNELNSYTFGTELNNYGVGIISDGSGHLIILSNDEINGYSEQKVAVRKIGLDGSQIWYNYHQSDQFEISSGIIADGEGYYYVAGSTIFAGQKDGLFLQMNDDGDFISNHIFGGNSNDWFEDIKRSNDGNFVLCGATEIDGYDSWLMKLDQYGSIIWSRNLGFEGMDQANSVFQLNNSGYIITGVVETESNNDYYLIKTDSEGLLDININIDD